MALAAGLIVVLIGRLFNRLALDVGIRPCVKLQPIKPDAPAWSMNIVRGGIRLAAGVMLEPGSDIIQSYRTGIGQMVFTGKDVTLDNLGVDNSLVWIPPVVEI